MSEEKKPDGGMETVDEKTALKEAEEEAENNELDSSKVQFINGGASGAEIHVDIDGKSHISDNSKESFCGLTKDELMQYADDPFWVKVRWILLILFWVAWFGMLAAAIIIIVLAPKCPPRPQLDWWQKSMVYQVYPRSFMDTNGDGVGDIKGIENKLDFLLDMNVSALYLNPMYPSGGSDFGYDITDFKAIDQLFGTIEDFQDLKYAMHKRGMKMIMDFIPNHTSRNHTWFQESRKGGDDNKYKDYYVWSIGKTNAQGDNVPPNNWLSVFGGSAWTWDEERGMYYLHQFLPSQPDLNVNNEDVKQELKDVLQFWLEKGVDGFRVDAVKHLFETDDMSQDEPVSGKAVTEDDYQYLKHTLTTFQPKTFELVTEWREVLDAYSKEEGRNHPRLLVVESYDDTANQTLSWYNYNGKPGASMPFNMNLISIQKGCNAKCIRDHIKKWRNVVPAGDVEKWSNWQVGNHDNSRVASRMGQKMVNAVNLLLLTLPGTSFVYYGDEIGMHDVEISWEDTKDPAGIRWGEENYMNYTRDSERTPMQWTGGYEAGFTTGTPWLPLADDYSQRNVEAQSAHGSGVTNLEVFKSVARIRDQPSLLWGDMTDVIDDDNLLCYSRQAKGFPGYLVAINFGDVPTTADLSFEVDEEKKTMGTVVTSTNNFESVSRAADFAPDSEVDMRAVHLKPSEGVIIMYE